MLRRWCKKIGFCFFCLIAFLLFSGISYQFLGSKLDEKKYPPPGQMIDVGGYKMHLHCSGKRGPNVILDSGLGMDSTQWLLVQEKIAKFAHVCSYDRAGYRWSEASPYPRTSANIVRELHTLLANAKISPPYILVGHSFGGANVQLYAKTYPNEVAGLVLVDSANDKIFDYMPKEPHKNLMEKCLSNRLVAVIASYFGVQRFVIHLPIFAKYINMFPDYAKETILANQSSTQQIKTKIEEEDHLKESMEQVKNANPYFKDLPLTVIAAGRSYHQNAKNEQWREYYQQLYEVWRYLQQDLAKRSTKGKLVIAENSDHMIPWHQPEIIAQAVQSMVDETK